MGKHSVSSINDMIILYDFRNPLLLQQDPRVGVGGWGGGQNNSHHQYYGTAMICAAIAYQFLNVECFTAVVRAHVSTITFNDATRPLMGFLCRVSTNASASAQKDKLTQGSCKYSHIIPKNICFSHMIFF